jgi:hypothetical protein
MLASSVLDGLGFTSGESSALALCGALAILPSNFRT